MEKVTETVNWLEAEMLTSEGGFEAAQDADSEGVEGKFYTWRYSELEKLVGDEMPWLRKLYNLKIHGNWEDGVNILFQTSSYREVAEEFNLSEAELVKKLKAIKTTLLEHRNQRIFPGKDDKILAGWNGLMSTGLVQAYIATGDKRMLDLALNNLKFIQEKLMVDGVLFRSYKNGKAYTPGFLEDYAAVIEAALKGFRSKRKK